MAEEKTVTNQVLETIKNRRSIRSYESKPVPRSILNAIIEAGNQAPYWGWGRSWRFVVVQDPEFRKKLRKVAVRNYQKWKESVPDDHHIKRARALMDKRVEDPVYYSAPVIVFVIGSSEAARTSCLLALQNMMLAAKSLGLGSCCVGFGRLIRDDEEIVETLELREDEIIFPIVLGYPKETPPGWLWPGQPEPAFGKQDLVVKWI